MAFIPDSAAWPDRHAPEPVRLRVAPPSGIGALGLPAEVEAAWARAMIAVNTDGKAAEPVVAQAVAVTDLASLADAGCGWRIVPFLPAGWVYFVWVDEPDEPADSGYTLLASEDTQQRYTWGQLEAAMADADDGLWRLRKTGQRYRRS